jgi:flagellar FliL protein
MAKEEAAPAAEAAPKKKKTLLIIIIAVVALLLVGGGAAVYLLTSKPAAEKHAKVDGEEAGHGDEGDAEEEEGEEHPPIYEKLETFTVNLADGETYLQVEISLKVADAKVQEKLKAHMPEVRDAMLRLLSSKSPEELSEADGKAKLAKEIQKQMNELIGAKKAKKGVQGVLFTAFILQ